MTEPETPRRSPHLPFAASHGVEHDELASAIFNAQVLTGGVPVLHADNWATRANAVGLEGERIFAHRTRWGRREIIRVADGIVDVGLFSGQANVAVAADSDEAARRLLEQLRALLPAPDPSGAQEVTVTFWTYGPHGPQPAWRTISVPAWTDIETNYAASTHGALERLMTDFQPAHGGQLVLWHGDVGTGKTFALRALAWEWRDWCDIHYIVDPDSFFGQHADYLLHVILQQEWEAQFSSWQAAPGVHVTASEATIVNDASEEAGEPRRKPWRLLVLEDTGELLQPDAKAVIGQGLSRFLNLADGLIGQGLRVLVLVTTNEEIRKLHPAVARPGRSAANVLFAPLGREESGAWLTAHGLEDDDGRSSSTIAELYARLEGLDTPKQSLGFDSGA